MMRKKVIEDYMKIILQFIDSDLTAVEFEVYYLRMFKGEERWMGEEAFEALNDLFCSADAFVVDIPTADQGYADQGYIDEATFRKAAELTYQKLKEMR